MKNGIDVSKHQGNIDWNAVKQSGKVDFACKCGTGCKAESVDYPLVCCTVNDALARLSC